MSFRFVIPLSVASLLLGCGNDTGAPAVTYGPLLGTLTEQVILPEHQAFAAKGDALVVALQALAASPGADTLASAQSAWRDARQAYRVMDALDIGPDYTLHIQDRIDAYPADDAGIEAIVSGTGAVDDAAVGDAGGPKKGFLGLEYLIFPPSDGSGPAPVLASDGIAPRRLTFAVSMSDEIASSAHQLDDAWEPAKGAFSSELENAGAGSSTYSTQRSAVDALANGVSQGLELIVGIRLALPLGRANGGTPDPTQDPTSRSDNCVADMQNTLSGVNALYAGMGFSSYVSGKSSTLDALVQSEMADSVAKLAAIPAPFDSALVNDTSAVQAAYNSTDALKKTWNDDVLSALGATLKAGDQDGD